MRKLTLLNLFVVLALVLAACAPPTPEVIEKEVVVEKLVVETVVVEKEKVVEKPVVETVVIEKEVVVEKPVVQTVVIVKEVTPIPTPSKYNEAPELAGLVLAG